MRCEILTMRGTLRSSCSWESLDSCCLMTPLKSQNLLSTHFMALGHWVNGLAEARGWETGAAAG